MLKKIAIVLLFIVCLLMASACNTEEKDVCYVCGLSMSANKLVRSENEEYICYTCYGKEALRTCANCNRAIVETNVWHDEYCEGCIEDYGVSCASCGGRINVRYMLDFQNGYYWCPSCATDILGTDNDIRNYAKRNSVVYPQ